FPFFCSMSGRAGEPPEMTSKLRRTAGPRWLLGAFVFSVACAGDPRPEATKPGGPPAPASSPATPPAFEGTSQVQAALLSGFCTLSATAASIAAADGETVSISYRASDGKVILNANTSGGAPCEIAS